MSSFDEKTINSSIMYHFSQNYAGGGSVAYDGEPQDFQAVTKAVDVDVLTFHTGPHRKSGLETQKCTLIAYCWAKSDTDIYAGRDTADAVAAVWDQAEIPIYDYDATGEPQVGGLRLGEAVVDDQTEELEDDLRTDWQKFRVIVEGTAQEI